MERKTNHVFILILSVMVIGMAVLCFVFFLGKTKAEKASAEFKAAYDELLEKNRETIQAAEEYRQSAEEYRLSYERLVEENQRAEEEKRNSEQLAVDYQNRYSQLVQDILDDAALAERMGNLIVSVWHNAIWKNRDDETDKYTISGGSFVTNFNDALWNLFNDEDFSENISTLTFHQFLVRDTMKEMLAPPDGFEKAYSALESLYISYLSFTNIVINCKGSLESFSKDFSDADKDLMQQYQIAELFAE
jgi:hypothetical protein